MMKHTRTQCGECHREWVEPKNMANSSPMTITGNRRDDLCPICGSGSIKIVEYIPRVIGLDIDTPEEQIPVHVENTGEDYVPDESKKPNLGHINSPLTLVP